MNINKAKIPEGWKQYLTRKDWRNENGYIYNSRHKKKIRRSIQKKYRQQLKKIDFFGNYKKANEYFYQFN